MSKTLEGSRFHQVFKMKTNFHHLKGKLMPALKLKTNRHHFHVAMAYLLGMCTALLITVVGTYSSTTQAQKDIYQMTRICKQSYQVTSGTLENSCGNLIDRVQAQGFEVLHDSKGNFWAESVETTTPTTIPTNYVCALETPDCAIKE